MRGIVRARDASIPGCRTSDFLDKLQQIGLDEQAQQLVEPLRASLEVLNRQIAEVDLRIEGLCEEEPVIRRLMTVPCIGSVVAAAFVNPGMEGGRAIAEAILGKINPSGKLTISFPLHVGQQPVFYNQVRGQHGTRYADLTQEPLFPFGHGLSYTTYRYSNARLASPTPRAAASSSPGSSRFSSARPRAKATC